MKGKLKKLLFTGIFACVFLFAGVFTACKDDKKVEFVGFDVKESVNVDYGSIVNVETPIVTDSNGNLYEVWTDVCDSEGGYVAVESNSFRAWDENGYTITYVVRANESYAEEKKTIVSVTNRQSFAVTAEYETLVDTDKSLAILPKCEEEGVTYSYLVRKLADNSEIPVTITDGKASYICTEKGYYDVTITATKGERSGSFGYTVLAREAASAYLVEHIDEQWEEIANYENDQRLGYYEVVTSEECGLTDRYGDSVSFLHRETDNEWPTYHINPRYSYEHYEALAAEGYDKVTLWCYFESEKDQNHTYAMRYGLGGYYETQYKENKPNTWIEMSFQLETPANVVNHSFLYCYEMYKNQDVFFVCWNNEGSLATRDKMSIYYTDMYVTKPVTVTVAEDARTDYTLGDTLTMSDLKALFVSEEEMRYYVTYRGEREEITEDYVFTGNGEYTLDVLPARKDYRASATTTITVADEFEAQASYVSVERTAATVNVNLNGLNASFKELDGVKPSVSGYRVFDKNGNEYAVSESNTFTADADGVYRVEVEGRYKVGETNCRTYHFVELDVWSEANKYAAVDLDGYFSISGYSYQSFIKDVLTIGEYAIDGKTEEMVQIYAAGRETSVVVMKPKYSKNYYKALLEANLDYALYVTCDWYFDASEQTSNVTPYYDMFTDYVKQGVQEKDTWHTGKLALSSFISLYDEMVELYDRTLEEYAEGLKYGRFADVSGVKDPAGNVVKGYLMATKLQTNRVDYAYLTAMTVEKTDSVEEFTYSSTIDESVFQSQKKGATIDLTQGKALFNGYELNASQYTLTSTDASVATVENNVLTIKDYGLLELVFTVTLPSGKTYESITYHYQITVDNEAVDGFENDGVGDEFKQNT